jgi:signal transduction histidine kinase
MHLAAAFDLVRDSIECFPDGVAVLGADGCVVVANAAYHRMNAVVEPWAGTRTACDEVGMVELDGAERWFHVVERSAPSGAMLRHIRDVTEHRLRQLDLMASQVRLREAIESLEEGFALYDASDRLVMTNSRYRELFPLMADAAKPGMSFEQIIRIAVERMHGDTAAAQEAWVQRRLDAHRSRAGLSESRFRDGRIITATERKTVDGGTISTFSDVTEFRATAERLHQSQKLEALGQLAGGVAHEFNNLLTAIGGFAKMAVRRPELSAFVRDCLEEIVAATDRAAHLTRQMLTFGRKEPIDARLIDPADVIGGLDRMLRSLLPETVELDFALTHGGARIKADPNQLSQAVLNLVLNARDALPQGGRIAVGARAAPAPASAAAAEKQLSGKPCIAIFVSDNGTGMSGDVLRHLFEPFFTTKEQGKGTGLGLSVVYSIVDGAGGLIDIDTAVGRGTTFSIFLPIVAGASSARAAEPARRGPEHVMVVARDADVRSLAFAALTQRGFACIKAADGEEATLLLDRAREMPRLLVTDMPLAASLAARLPALKIIEVADGGGASLRKSFSPEELVAAVRAALA